MAALPPGRLAVNWPVLCMFAVLAAAGAWAGWTVQTTGFWVTGMTNHVTWGLPHAVAFCCLIGASGALHVSSFSSLFGRPEYRPLAPLSVFVAIVLLLSGLAALVLDLGRATRVLLVMQSPNPTSMLAWNGAIYPLFLTAAATYLWTMVHARGVAAGRVAAAAVASMAVRLVMTTGTGVIFAVLVARAVYGSAMMVPVFIALSLSLGTAMVVLAAAVLGVWRDVAVIGPALRRRLARTLGMTALAALWLVAVQHVVDAAHADRHAAELLLLFRAWPYPAVFWGGFVLAGSVLPVLLAFAPNLAGRPATAPLAAACVAGGAVSLMYVITAGGQAVPIVLFPGWHVTSAALDGAMKPYAPTWTEVALSLGAIGVAGTLLVVGARLLPLFPERDVHAAP